jgi:hypothetical protein
MVAPVGGRPCDDDVGPGLRDDVTPVPGESGLAHPGLAAHQGEARLTDDGIAPELVDELPLTLPADEQGRGVPLVVPVALGNLRLHVPRADLLRDAVQSDLAERSAGEAFPRQIPGRPSDDDAAWWRLLLQAAGDARRHAVGRPVPVVVGADRTERRLACVYADADRQRCVQTQCAPHRSDLPSNRETTADGPLGIVFLCPRVAEVQHDAVADVLRHVTIVDGGEPAEQATDRVLDLAHVLGIQPLEHRGRVDKITKKESQWPALALGVDRVVGQQPAAASAEARARRTGEAAFGTFDRKGVSALDAVEREGHALAATVLTGHDRLRRLGR